LARRRSRLTPNIVWDPRLGSTGRYVDAASGQMVPQQFVQDQLEKQIEVAGRQMRALSTQLAEGDISLATWRNQMAERMKIIHVQSAALSKGGWAQMSQSDWGSVGRITRNEYAALNGFALDIQSGKQKLFKLDGETVNGNLLRRTDLYAQAGNGTKAEMERRQGKINGFTHEMRVLDPAAQHCNCCLAAAGRWELIGVLPRLGACDCASNDRCHFVFGSIDPQTGQIVQTG
jgi:hypothetical protein